MAIADRPTITMTPLDDSEFTRKLFTPMPLEGVLYLTKTTWPISTVFRLWLENLNWVSNAQNASGPAQESAPDYERFLAGVEALQRLQNRNQLVFTNEARDETLGGSLPASRIKGSDLVEAAKNGFEYRLDESTSKWNLIRKKIQPVLRIDPSALESADAEVFMSSFGLKRNQWLLRYRDRENGPVSACDPFCRIDRSRYRDSLIASGTLLCIQRRTGARGTCSAATRRHGSGWVRLAVRLESASPRICSRYEPALQESPPAGAHVAIKYLGHWFYIDRTDHASMSTFSLLQELARLETSGRQGVPPALTIPLSGR